MWFLNFLVCFVDLIEFCEQESVKFCTILIMIYTFFLFIYLTYLIFYQYLLRCIFIWAKKNPKSIFWVSQYSRVPNKHAGMLIYSASKNPVRHAYCGRHAANGTLPMTRSCPLHTSNMCSVSPQFVPVHSEDIVLSRWLRLLLT